MTLEEIASKAGIELKRMNYAARGIFGWHVKYNGKSTDLTGTLSKKAAIRRILEKMINDLNDLIKSLEKYDENIK